jgi:hypothetical protein
MRHDDFRIGIEFRCGDREWLCTDKGSRVVVAICVDRVEVGSNTPELRRTLNRTEAAAEGWFNGPPYAVCEYVFDEDAQEDCSSIEPRPSQG